MEKQKEKKSKYFQGLFKPKNPQKYLGDVKNINYRSGWEFAYMRKLDADENVVGWASEEFHIPYVSPIDKRKHRYFPDFLVKRKNKLGIVEVFIVEIKPAIQAKRPKKTSNKARKTIINEHATYLINQAKWRAAEIFCERNKYIFQVLTEKELNIK